jgi:hypothetical protein
MASRGAAPVYSRTGHLHFGPGNPFFSDRSSCEPHLARRRTIALLALHIRRPVVAGHAEVLWPAGFRSRCQLASQSFGTIPQAPALPCSQVDRLARAVSSLPGRHAPPHRSSCLSWCPRRLQTSDPHPQQSAATIVASDLPPPACILREATRSQRAPVSLCPAANYRCLSRDGVSLVIDRLWYGPPTIPQATYSRPSQV